MFFLLLVKPGNKAERSRFKNKDLFSVSKKFNTERETRTCPFMHWGRGLSTVFLLGVEPSLPADPEHRARPGSH